MNKYFKFGIGIASTILAGITAINIRPIANSISSAIGTSPVFAEARNDRIK